MRRKKVRINYQTSNKMKKTLIIVMLLSTVVLLGSCGNANQETSKEEQTENVEDDEDETPLGMFAYEQLPNLFEYEIVLDPSMSAKTDPFFAYNGDLAIKRWGPVYSDYLYFDDEANYNDYIREWLLASYISILLVDYYSANWEENKEKASNLLTFVGELPNTNHIEDPEIAEIFKRAYYNLKSLNIYLPNERYGYKEYPLGASGKGISIRRQGGWVLTYHYATLLRTSGEEAFGVEDGALGISLNGRSILEFLEDLGL